MKILGVILLSFFYLNSPVVFGLFGSNKPSTQKTAHHKKENRKKPKGHLLKLLDKTERHLRKYNKGEETAHCIKQQKQGSLLSNKCKKLLGISIQNRKPLVTTQQSVSPIAPAQQQIAPQQQSDSNVGASLLGGILGNLTKDVDPKAATGGDEEASSEGDSNVDPDATTGGDDEANSEGDSNVDPDAATDGDEEANSEGGSNVDPDAATDGDDTTDSTTQPVEDNDSKDDEANSEEDNNVDPDIGDGSMNEEEINPDATDEENSQ